MASEIGFGSHGPGSRYGSNPTTRTRGCGSSWSTSEIVMSTGTPSGIMNVHEADSCPAVGPPATHSDRFDQSTGAEARHRFGDRGIATSVVEEFFGFYEQYLVVCGELEVAAVFRAAGFGSALLSSGLTDLPRDLGHRDRCDDP